MNFLSGKKYCGSRDLVWTRLKGEIIIQNIFSEKLPGEQKNNSISALRKDDGCLTENLEEMKGITNSFFKQLYSCDASVDPSHIISLVKPRVTDDMNDDLCKPFTEKEISDALFQMGPLKAPGPDGFPARFFQRNWGLIKDDIVKAVQQFFISRIMPDGINNTTIVLIPKIKNPQTIKDFRPISLCNVIYKIISKCLVNRLRPLLDGMISPTQSAFIPGRLISDNALIAFECMHSLSTLKDSRGEFCAYKLDLAKAFDRVDWRFLQCMMGALGVDKLDYGMSYISEICGALQRTIVGDVFTYSGAQAGRSFIRVFVPICCRGTFFTA